MTLWTSRDELEAAVVAYRSSWWRDNDEALAVINDRRAHPRLRARLVAISALGQLVSTADVYRSEQRDAAGDRPYLDQRLTLHRRIAARCVPAAAVANTDGAHPAAYFTIGCPGAGKTTVLREIVERRRVDLADDAEPDPCSIIDADQVRQLLPEYADGLGSLVVQQECFDLTYGLVLDEAVARRADLIFDTMGRLSSIAETVERLRSHGYRIHMLHASSSFELCCERTERRALDVDGRIVAPGLIRDAIESAAQTLRALLDGVSPLESWAKIDTTDMAAPSLIEGTPPWEELL
jgi:hypothetical protein